MVVMAIMAMASCRTVGEYAYISDADIDSSQAILKTYSTTIHPGDLLYIYVYSLTPELVIPFNQETHTLAAEVSKINMVDTMHRSVIREQHVSEVQRERRETDFSGYLVDEHGFIIMPVLGKMNVAGITLDSLQSRLEHTLRDGGYIKDAVVTVSTMNFRVSVVGEVRVPHELHIAGNRLTIFEALALCGDITMYGMRDNVTVMREKNGVAVPITIDLTKKSMFDSEVYYLQTNDIVYVEPNEKMKKRADMNTEWPKYTVFGVSLVSALVNIVGGKIRTKF